jgi:hypothetical protein
MIDLYTTIHKGQRKTLFEISIDAGKADYTNPESLNKLQKALVLFKEEMRLHALLEEKLIHPLLAERVPRGQIKLEEDHRLMHKELDALLQHLESLRNKSADFEKRGEIALEFYRAWNRFIAFYLTHINMEEEQIQPLLWELCTDVELSTVFKKFLAEQKPNELMINIKMMIPALNIAELVYFVEQGRANAPPEMVQAVLNLAEQLLKPEEWKLLNERLPK